LTRSNLWGRHPANPILGLRPGFFDANHIHAPMVVKDNGHYRMWYSGSDRLLNEFHRLGYAESSDGIKWTRRDQPVIAPTAPSGYYTCPSILREATGEVRREGGLLWMWYSGSNTAPDLHLSTSPDGIHWTNRPEPIARGVYSPTVIHEDGRYRMWYTGIADGLMTIRYGTSEDGIDWNLYPTDVLRSSLPWERRNLLYPFVLRRDDTYQMYYTSYDRICELAVATSDDGIRWKKGGGPILSPDPASKWDSLYCSKACVVPEPGGPDKLYYASRVDMNHKYFAIGLAIRAQIDTEG
jgi:predicted GH43/DUF377 family glycosyl hydrolase